MEGFVSDFRELSAWVLLAGLFIFAGLNKTYLHYGRKLQRKLPLMQWKTFEQVCAYGCPRIAARFVLYFLVKRRIVEVRLSTVKYGAATASIRMFLDGYHTVTPLRAEFFDYRLIDHDTRRRRRVRVREPEDGELVPMAM